MGSRNRGWRGNGVGRGEFGWLWTAFLKTFFQRNFEVSKKSLQVRPFSYSYGLLLFVYLKLQFLPSYCSIMLTKLKLR